MAIYGISADSEILFLCSIQKLFDYMFFDRKYISLKLLYAY
jgi:hypothetical protein